MYKTTKSGGVRIYANNYNKFEERTDLTISEDGIIEYIFIVIENIKSAKIVIGVIHLTHYHANFDIFLGN